MRVMKHWNKLLRGGRCPIPGDIQGEVGWGSEQPDVVEDVPAHCRGGGLRGPLHPKLFYDSVFVNEELMQS